MNPTNATKPDEAGQEVFRLRDVLSERLEGHEIGIGLAALVHALSLVVAQASGGDAIRIQMARELIVQQLDRNVRLYVLAISPGGGGER